MLIELANHNDDIRRLLDKGYALRMTARTWSSATSLTWTSKRSLQVGAIVTKLEFIDKLRVKQVDHQVYFAGTCPTD